MLFNKKFDLVLSIGEDCACAMYLRDFKLRKQSYPFDWLTKADFNTRIELILNNFNDFLNKNDLKYLKKPEGITDNNCNYYENVKTDFYFYHDFKKDIPFDKMYNAVNLKYTRRINRFYKKITSNKNILFVWWSRDKHLDNNYLREIYKKLSDKFEKQNINLLIFENDEKLNDKIETQTLNPNIIKKISNIAKYDTSKPQTETQGNLNVNNSIFAEIQLKKNYIEYIYIKTIKLITNIVSVFYLKKDKKNEIKNKILKFFID